MPRKSRQVGVVDDAPWGRVSPEGERFVQEAFHLEAIEAAVELEVAPLAVAQVEETGGDLVELLAQADRIERGVVLHLCSRLIGHLVAAAFGALLADAQFAQHPRQGGVAHFDAFFLGEFFVHPLDVASALLVEVCAALRDRCAVCPCGWFGASRLSGQ